MGKLQVAFTAELSHPLLAMVTSDERAVLCFSDTGNLVSVSISIRHPSDVVLVSVERECDPDKGRDASYEGLHSLGISRDAGRAFGLLLETLRDLELSKGVVCGYPVARSDTIHSNPLVLRCSADWLYEGELIRTLSFGGEPVISIDNDAWSKLVQRLAKGERVPAWRRFLLDAFYFCTTGDPDRAVIMAAAAMEVALRDTWQT